MSAAAGQNVDGDLNKGRAGLGVGLVAGLSTMSLGGVAVGRGVAKGDEGGSLCETEEIKLHKSSVASKNVSYIEQQRQSPDFTRPHPLFWDFLVKSKLRKKRRRHGWRLHVIGGACQDYNVIGPIGPIVTGWVGNGK